MAEKYLESFHPSIIHLLVKSEVIGIDPGDSTGIYRLKNGAGETLDYLDMLNYLRCYTSGSVLVVERFTNRPAAFAKAPIAAKICGAIDYHCFLNMTAPVWQEPSVIKTMMPSAVELKSLGWHWKTRHEFDALRHALYYVLTNKSEDSRDHA